MEHGEIIEHFGILLAASFVFLGILYLKLQIELKGLSDEEFLEHVKKTENTLEGSPISPVIGFFGTILLADFCLSDYPLSAWIYIRGVISSGVYMLIALWHFHKVKIRKAQIESQKQSELSEADQSQNASDGSDESC